MVATNLQQPRLLQIVFHLISPKVTGLKNAQDNNNFAGVAEFELGPRTRQCPRAMDCIPEHV